MANIQQRAGSVVIRVGGNTQETAVLVDETPGGRILEKDPSKMTNPVRHSQPLCLFGTYSANFVPRRPLPR